MLSAERQMKKEWNEPDTPYQIWRLPTTAAVRYGTVKFYFSIFIRRFLVESCWFFLIIDFNPFKLFSFLFLPFYCYCLFQFGTNILFNETTGARKNVETNREKKKWRARKKIHSAGEKKRKKHILQNWN